MLDQQVTRKEFAAIVGVSRQVVDALVQRKVLRDEDTLRQSLSCYCDHVRNSAAGRTTSEARERIDRARAERHETENALRNGTLAPRALLEDALGLLSRQIVTVLDGLPGRIKRRDASIKPRTIEIVGEEIVKIRRLAAAVRLGDGSDEDETT